MHGLLLDATDSFAGLHANLDIACVTPGGSPRVLDKVVLSPILRTVADGQDSMVELGATGRSSDDSRLVRLEGSFVSFDGH